MPWVVDSGVLLDVALKDPEHGVSSALFLEDRRGDGLLVCPITVIEVAPFFDGDVGNVREFLKVMGAESATPWMEADTEEAVRGWTRYVRLRRAKETNRRPIADILIGAFAARQQGLITRNPEHFRPFFPELTLLEPLARRRAGAGASVESSPEIVTPA
jgi:predicted nucleic acid-binding protein